jgi:hypothetical protein
MNFSHLTPAGDTAAILQEAARAGSDVMIPGAFERRASRPAVPSPVAPADVAALHAPAAVMSDWQRLEYEREGGGAPIERRSSRRRRLLSRLWRWVLYPSDPPAIVHPLPAQW